jgi:NAD(P)-dependent dehydrogenase (short-subunit alcohol dehydrogenase family)
MMEPPIISHLGVTSIALEDESVIITGSSGGIGYGAFRALLWLGAHVITAEINIAKSQPAIALCHRVRLTLKDQSVDWKRRSLFERDYVICDFRKTAVVSSEEWPQALDGLKKSLMQEREVNPPQLARMAECCNQLVELAKGYQKEQEKFRITCSMSMAGVMK